MATNDETDLDIVDVLNTVFPGEKHLPGMRYCGPGTSLNLRVDENGKPFPGNEPVDRVDEAALKHDLAYKKHDDLRHRHMADKECCTTYIILRNPPVVKEWSDALLYL